MSRLKSLLFLLVLFLLALAAQVPLASATVTYVVGTCKPSFPLSSIFMHIQDALNATPAPNVVEVCPATYAEQVVITHPVTLEGVSDGSSSGATISVPSGGLVVNATTSLGQSLAVQVLVENAGGEVNLSSLIVDGSGNNVVCTSVVCPYVAGVFYQNSPGTMNHLTAQNQSAIGQGVGVWLEGGSANPSVTIENSSLQGFDNAGIFASEAICFCGGELSIIGTLTANIKGNYLGPSAPPFNVDPIGLSLSSGTVTVTGNLIAGIPIGMELGNGDDFTGPISRNTVVSTQTGILDLNCCGQVTSNTVFNSSGTGIGVFPSESEAPVTGNIIVQSATAIDFDCFAGGNVHSNTILGATNGLNDVPSGVLSPNTYYGVGTIRTTGTVSNGHCQ